ncbi:secretogranin III copy 1-like [Scleropages formosus]|uniref:Secretogranin-3 n=1 Tax=Scleropages formosus TaxID=113540 RepID=A0A0P7USY5_SCLFO|nr:secretogranin III copy 1-like [Scleropages formosus]
MRLSQSHPVILSRSSLTSSASSTGAGGHRRQRVSQCARRARDERGSWESMAPRSLTPVRSLLLLVHMVALSVTRSGSMPTLPVPGGVADRTLYDRGLSEERPLQEQIAQADSVSQADPADSERLSNPKASQMDPDNDDFSLLKSLAERSRDPDNETPDAEDPEDRYFTDDSDSTKNRRLAEDYDSTKNSMDYKDQDDTESFHTVDGTPLTAEDIVRKIATKIYEEDDRGVFDRIVSKLLKLGLISESQAETLEYEVAEVLQELIAKNAKDNEVEARNSDYPASRVDEDEDVGEDPELDSVGTWDEGQDVLEIPDRKYDDEVETEDSEDGEDVVDDNWNPANEVDHREDGGSEDGLQDLQYFPNFYNLLKSLDSEEDAEERETLITIMKTLIDFVKMMVKYGTITPEEGVSYLDCVLGAPALLPPGRVLCVTVNAENLDTMIAVQTKNKLGKSLMTPDVQPPTEKPSDESDNTKAEAAKMQKEYESLKDSTKDNQAVAETDYDLSKLRDFMDQQVDSYINKGILQKDEGEVIKRIYSSL